MKRLRDAYQNFWIKVVKVAQGKAEQLPPNGLQFAMTGNGTIRVSTRIDKPALWFRGLTARMTQGGRTDFDVYLQLDQTIRGLRDSSTGALRLEAVRCTVRMQYLEYRSPEEIQKERAGDLEPARAYHGIHFDYVCPGEAHHPYFHAQLDHGCIPAEQIQRRYTPTPALVGRCDAPRIPTPPMDLPAVVYTLLHDHLSNVVAKGWPEELRKAMQGLPLLDTNPFSTFVKPNMRMESTWWYEHAGHHN